MLSNFQHDAILNCAHSYHPAPKPQYVFQVISSIKSTSEAKWKELAKHHSVFYAFHGNRLENFYTILNFGLQQHLNKINKVISDMFVVHLDIQ